ncbi:hypothetical protein GCM10023321_84810 [Pseudonocardia eucalypti]|uniref:Guanylate cyclase domain-containing protein n=1 Tax=Pseudonocardia eucalypti TaxID=648755 RepID=A0ABP9RGQ8_9PSEU|nr:putative ATPase/class 3 adenylate cyclase [Pseudonocardia eucalypti]
MTASVELDGPLVGRRTELAQLTAAMAAADRRGGELVLVGGAPGMGKSTLVRAFGAAVREHGGLFGYGRFSGGVRTPYAAVAQALGELVAAMAGAAPAERDRWQADVVRGLSPAGAGELAGLVPGLGELLGGPSPANGSGGAPDPRHRLCRAVGLLLAATANYRPVALAIDDLHLADRDSLQLLSELLAAPTRNLLLIGTYRSGEFDPGTWSAPSDRPPIDLGPLSAGELESLLDVVCGRSPELPAVAGEFQLRTGGNPLRVHQLLGRARRAGALEQGDSTAWDLATLTALATGEDDDEFFARAVGQLAPPERAVLGELACIGGEFELELAVDAAGRPPDEVARVIWAAMDARLLTAVDRRGRALNPVIGRDVRYRFSHDRVAEAAAVGLPEETRLGVHRRIGLWLIERDEDRLFEAARHLASGGPCRDGEGPRFAEVQLRAAELARRQASFPLALEHAMAGLALLAQGGRPEHPEHPELARRLLLGAAEAAYQVGDSALLVELLERARTRLAEPVDRAALALLQVRGLVAEHRLQDALAAGLAVLAELGHAVPRRSGRPRAAAELVRLRLAMRRWPDQRLLELPRCADPVLDQVHLILDQLRNISFRVAPESFPLIVGKELDLTLTTGLGPSSPVSLASYGLLLVASGDHAGAQRFGEVALRLAERPEFLDTLPRVQFLRLNFIRHWQRPLHEGLGEVREAYRRALDGGDREYAALLAAVLLYQSVCVGRPMAEVDAMARAMVPEIQSELMPALLCRSTQQLCLNLMGRTADPLLLAGESGYDERVVLPVAQRENDVVGLSAAAVTRLVLHYWCEDYAGAVRLAEETGRYLAGLTGTVNMQVFHLFNALSRIRVAPGERATARAVRRALAAMRRWASDAPGNYAAPYELLAGTWARARGAVGRAERHLDRAIALAEEYQLPVFAAAAHEEAGALYARTGRASLSRIMVRSAYEGWISLGVLARGARMEQAHPWLLGRDLMRPSSATPDPAALHRLAQALAEAQTMRALAEVLLRTVADTTGAERVLLFLGEADRPVVTAVCRGGVVTMVAPGSAAPDHDPSPLVEAARTGRPALAAGALVVPILARESMVGAVYAEHGEPQRAFGLAHREALRTACAYAAAPLVNLEMEGRLLRADEQRRSLVDAQSRFISPTLLRMLDLDDLSRVRHGHRVERRMTVLVSDIRGYTGLLEGMSVSEASDLVTGFLRAVELPIIANNGLVQDMRGDEVLAVFDTGPDDAVRAGLAMLRSLREHNRERVGRGSRELRVGIGVNTGPVALAMVGGVNRMALAVIGDSVNLASRLEGATKRYQVSLVIGDQTYAELAEPERFHIRRMERVMVVNRARPVTVYEVFDEDPESVRAAKNAARGAFDEAFARFDAGDVAGARDAFERCRELLPGDQVAPLHLAHCAAMLCGEVVPGEPVSLGQK